MSTDKASKVGLVSLWTSIAGVLIAVILVALLQVDVVRPYLLVGIVVFFGLELVALFTGISDRKSSAGRLGLQISSVSLTVGVLACLALVPVRVSR